MDESDQDVAALTRQFELLTGNVGGRKAATQGRQREHAAPYPLQRPAAAPRRHNSQQQQSRPVRTGAHRNQQAQQHQQHQQGDHVAVLVRSSGGPHRHHHHQQQGTQQQHGNQQQSSAPRGGGSRRTKSRQMRRQRLKAKRRAEVETAVAMGGGREGERVGGGKGGEASRDHGEDIELQATAGIGATQAHALANEDILAPLLSEMSLSSIPFSS